ncbi:hypothetical protein [Defluviimonas salinarum]|uniref:Uncharacterized protein n=1 Tax=Defluviimonas salinarum TaxID=2992147 RepID=A0ABT3J5P9_9RHOB|nr:hypothetical protein [Defluviimonas salinarum]MCW3783017.1 hypothetical protein [Defluviimonas salinarum]
MKAPIINRDPLFDPDIIRRRITPDWIAGQIAATLEGFARGEKKHFHRPLPSPEEMGTDAALRVAIPHPVKDLGLQAKILDILVELRGLGLLKPVPHGVDRGIHEAEEWNAFVADGAEAEPKWGWQWIFSLPLPRAIGEGLFRAGLDAIMEAREAAGLDAFAGRSQAERVGPKALMPVDAALIGEIARAAAETAAMYGSGQWKFFSTSEGPTCPKTDQRLRWSDEHLLDPMLGSYIYPEGGKMRDVRFELIGAFDAPMPCRHVEITLPSGILYMADWFRIPGFNEGVGKDDPDEASINSDLGVDLRTRDHVERLGLMRIHTTNCYPAVMREGDILRVGHFNEEHDDLWQENPEEPGDVVRTDIPEPDMVGRVCCDLWDVTFADQEILKDILMAGAAAIEANGGIGDRGREVKGAPATRQEAQRLLEDYARENDIVRLEFAPGTTLHVYMATGGKVELFAERFESPDLPKKAWIEDLFLISTRPLEVDPYLVDEPGWAWPERYAAPAENGPELEA